MSKTLGFYLLEKYFRKYQCWPTSQGLRGFGPIILTAINVVWMFYPTLIAFINYKTNFTKCLFHMQFFMVGALIVSGNIQILRNRNRLFNMIDVLSDFSQFNIPEGIKYIEKKFKAILKINQYGVFFYAGCLQTYFVMLEGNYANFKSTKYCTAVEYYVPFDLKPWGMTLIMLFQIYTLYIANSVVFLTMALYCYSFVLLITRIESLKEMIVNINLTRNKKRNCNILRPVVLYHQDIFTMFQLVKNLYTRLIVLQKIFVLISLTLSTTEFVLNKNLVNFHMIMVFWFGLFIIHTMGQRLITAASSVAEAVYDLNWYDADVSTRKDILILLCMSQKALVVEVPLLGQISHPAAAFELKKVYLFFNSLLTIMKKRSF